jgi:exodeoxyribonuclease V beta subunit
VREHYELQLQLYTLALVRLLGAGDEAAYDARFGGLLYCFVRGMRPDGDGTDGVYLRRPAWREVQAWERALGERAWTRRGAVR